jgi:GT2 family glycosyltransferase/glycosyltransferase involved in cell wall biosynthesis
VPVHHTHDAASAAAALDVRRGDTVVIVPVHDAFDYVRRCYASILRHTPADVPLLVVDDASHDSRVLTVLERELAADVGGRRVVTLRRMVNGGFVGAVNDGLNIARRADVVIVNSDVVVSQEWFQRLRDAAYSADTVASATTLTNHGTIVSVPNRNQPGPMDPDLDVDECARRVAAGAARLRPRIPTLVGHCAFVRRDALDVVGLLDPTLAPGYGEEVDWSIRAGMAGFEHVVADDVFVEHSGGASFSGAEWLRFRHEREAEIDRRYPFYAASVQRVAQDDTSPLAAALLAARRSLLGLHVAVDAMVLHPTPGGTQVGILETVRALASIPEIGPLDVLVRPNVPDYARGVLDEVPNVNVIPIELGAPPPGSRADVLLRPYQVSSVAEARWLRSLAQRLVINQLDLIAYHNPSYFGSGGEWFAYRDAQRLALAVADGVAFISEYSRQSTRDAGLLTSDRPTRIVGNGVEHYAHPRLTEEAQRPVRAEDVNPGFLLVLGVPYRHKNRPFALRVFERLAATGWNGELVFAGPTPTHGDSRALEDEWLPAHPLLATRVHDLGQVSEAGKVWLYVNAGLVLYPSVSEGFGLVPFEAAGFGVPCLSTRRGGLGEVLPPDIPTLQGWDAVAAAAIAQKLLVDDVARKQLVDAVIGAAEQFTWQATARALVDLMTEVTGRQRVLVDSIASESGEQISIRTNTSGPFGTATRDYLDSQISRLARNARVRSMLGPSGSKRDQVARKVLARLRAR